MHLRRRHDPEQRFVDEYQAVQQRETKAIAKVVRRARQRGVPAEMIAQAAARFETNEGLPRMHMVRSLAFGDDALSRTERTARMMVDDGLGNRSEREIITYAH